MHWTYDDVQNLDVDVYEVLVDMLKTEQEAHQAPGHYSG